MSVPKNERKENKLEVINCAEELAAYSFAMCKSEDRFPKRDRWLLAAPIVQTVMKILVNIKKANYIRVESKSSKEKRYSLQEDALNATFEILAYLEIAYNMKYIGGKSLGYWTGLVEKTRSILSCWMKSDKDRYKDI